MSPTRDALFTIGNPPFTVNGWRETLASGRKVVRIEWRDPSRKTKTWDDTAEGRRLARAFARGTTERLQRRGIVTAERIRIGDMFDKFILAQESDWRPKTRIGAMNNWRLFQEVLGPNTYADLVSEETLDEVRRALRQRKPRPIAASQIQKVIAQVKAVWTWARRRKLISENPIAEYVNRLPKDGKALDVPEFHPDEAAKIVAQLSHTSSRTWRTWGAILLGGLLGPRQNALLNLEWRDVDLTARTVRWRPELDKLGRDRTQPLPREAVFVFRVARIWAARQCYTGRFVFYAVQRDRRGDKPWTYSALNEQLADAERAAGIEHIKYRSMHGLRRMVAKTVLERTGGNLNKAGDYIGDVDLRTLKRSYLKQRPEELRGVAAEMTLLSPRNRTVSNVAATVGEASTQEGL